MFVFPNVPQDLLNAIRNCKRAVVCGHVGPDGDCANSNMAMGMLLKALGKNYILVNDGAFDQIAVKEFGNIVSQEVPFEWQNLDTLGIVVDCSTPDRLGSWQSLYSKLTVAVIDHHSSGCDFGSYRYVVPQSISTTLLIYKIYMALGLEMTEEFANLIFRGFATDSGFFRFLGSDSSETFRIIADLVNYNISPNEVYHAINGGKPFETVLFLSQLINRMEKLHSGRLIITHEDDSDSLVYGQSSRASDDFYAQILSLENVEAVFFFKKSRKIQNAIEVGMRASHFSSFDVGAFAKLFGGGGHVKAAGCTIEGSYEEVKEKVLSRAGQLYFN